jgi:ATP-dependent RNA helicase DDX23/PRP28
VQGGRAVNPLRKWDECPMHPLLRRAIDDMGYTAPTPIQRQAIPMGLAGRDLIGE